MKSLKKGPNLSHAVQARLLNMPETIRGVEGLESVEDLESDDETNSKRLNRALLLAVEEVLPDLIRFEVPVPRSRSNEALWKALKKARFRDGRHKGARGELWQMFDPFIREWLAQGRRPKPSAVAKEFRSGGSPWAPAAIPKGWTAHGYPGDDRFYLQSPKGRQYNYRSVSETILAIAKGLKPRK